MFKFRERIGKLLLLIIPWFLNFQIFAAVQQFRFDIFTQEDGLANNLVQCIYQDSRGWLWIGTS